MKKQGLINEKLINRVSLNGERYKLMERKDFSMVH